MRLDLQELLFGDVTRLRYVQRYATSFNFHKENVAEHSFYVAFYAMLIGEWYNENVDYAPITTREAVMKALVHDVDEAITGDMPRGFKYGHPEVKRTLNEAAEQEVKDVFERLGIARYSELWTYDKQGISGAIVSIADYMAVISHMLIEIRNNNHTMTRHISSIREYMYSFREDRYEVFRPLLADLEELILGVIGEESDVH